MQKITGLIGLVLLAGGMPVQAAQGDVLVRVRTIMVAPTEKSGPILPAFPGETVGVGNSFMPELDFTYMASDHIGLELILATTKHSLTGRTGTTGSIGKLGSTWVLPPTLTVQYHFLPEAKVRPYVGAGVNYSVFWNEKASDGLQAAVGKTDVRLSNSFGWALQAGTDIDLTKKIFLNLDVKYIDMRTTARLSTAAIGVQQVKVDINPIVAGIGLGFRF
ncbi:outer membrane protein [Polymorphobacter multimanifer]|uniref:Outer membrane protein n=1 Tax=Polymorphobacter multimanifer TaxID=1070431 RepID=A0A841L431_9SPHN|nr:OmpW family outer membrane protein [Polymorphobacter multimanifer]MBB6227180.1 outer membrane protein [Polymorphobacter multimanifer]